MEKQKGHSLELHSNNDSNRTQIKVLSSSPAIGRDGRKIQYNAQNIIDNFKKDQKQIRIDVDHLSETGGSTASLGWINDFHVKKDGLYAEVEWNKEGQSLVDGKIYKYVSPALTGNSSGDSFEAHAISSLALTNNPNLYLDDIASSKEYPNSNSNQTQEDKMLNSTGGTPKQEPQSKDLQASELQASELLEGGLLSRVKNLEHQLQHEQQKQHQIELDQVFLQASKEGQIQAEFHTFLKDSCKTKQDLEALKKHLNSMPKLSETYFNEQAPRATSHHSKFDISKEQLEQSGISAEQYRASAKQIKEQQKEELTNGY